jgi:hypothetical protein
MSRRRFPEGETIREVYASSYGESRGVRVQIIEIRIGPRGLPEGVRQFGDPMRELIKSNTQNV